MVLNKEKRIRILGFNDLSFMIVGIVILSFVTDYIFTNSFMRYPLMEAIITWSISLFFSICYWMITRLMLIALRQRFPGVQETLKRAIVMFLMMVVTIVLIDYLGNKLLFMGIGNRYNPLKRSTVLVPILLISMMVMAIYEAIYFYIKLKQSIREEEQAKQIIVTAQLDALRNQAQPHFFFNSLNTLRDIIDQNPREDAKEFVNRLAEVYRFILESGNSNVISLSDELKFAQAYIHIQSERFGDNLQVVWPEELSQGNAMVVPMSLQLLLENAIKHNVISKSKPLMVTIEVKDDRVKVSNPIQPKSSQLPSTKLGLNNIKHRYALLSDMPIEIDDSQGIFTVVLPLLQQQSE